MTSEQLNALLAAIADGIIARDKTIENKETDIVLLNYRIDKLTAGSESKKENEF